MVIERHQWPMTVNSCYFVEVVVPCVCVCVVVCVFFLGFAGVRLFIACVYTGVVNFHELEFSS